MDPINWKNSAVSENLAEFGFIEVKIEICCENNAEIDHFGLLFAQYMLLLSFLDSWIGIYCKKSLFKAENIENDRI